MTMKLKKTGIALLSAMLVLGNITHVMATQTAGTQQTTQTQSKTDTLQEEKEDAVKEIGDYGSITKLKTDAETAKKIDELVAKYQELIGTADKDKNKSGLSTSASIEDCVSSAKAAIDALVSGDDNNGQDDASVNPSSTSDFVMVGGDWVTPVATYGQNVNIVLPVVNMGSVNLANISVTPVISNSVTEWPFEIETSGYTQTITDLPGKGNGQSDMDRRRELTWTLKTREDAPSGYYKLQFTALYYVGTEAESATLTTYVKVVGAPGSGNVETEGSGSSTPRVIVTGFTTDPAEVNAGDTFTLTLHLKNTSKRTAVSNMLVNFNAPSEGSDTENTYAAFLPTSGSNTAYISSIGKNATTDLSIEMTAKSDLSQKPYQLDVTMDYEDDAYTAYTSTADVSIPIHQAAKFELSTPEILPATISVGNEADIMFSIYNTGKTTLYNVQVKFEGDSVTGGESFIGKIEAGGTGTVDALVTGQAATKDDGTIKAVITYEDEAGNESSYEQEMTLMVTEDTGLAGMDDWDMEEVEYDDSTGSSKKAVIITLIGVVLLTIAVVIVILLKKRKAKKLLAEELDLLEEDDEETDSVDDGEKDNNGKDDADEIS